jgi:hypothetical protein
MLQYTSVALRTATQWFAPPAKRLSALARFLKIFTRRSPAMILRMLSTLAAASLLFLPAVGLAQAPRKANSPTKAPAAKAKAAPAKVTAAPQLLTDAELAEGWIALFDGQTLFGWQAQSKADWQVKDGAIFVSKGERGLLTTTVEFDNYVLKLDFRAAQAANSGVFLRTPAVVGMNDITTKCYELNIAPPDNPFPTGSYVGRQKAAAVPERAGASRPHQGPREIGRSGWRVSGGAGVE